MSTPASVFLRAPWAMPQGVSSVLVIAPVDEPLDLAQGKLRAGLDWPDGDPRDALMRGFIAAARQKVEQDTALALLTQTRAVAFSAWACAEGIIPLPMQATPVQSITDPDGNPVDVRRFRLDPRRRALLFDTAVSSGVWTVVAGWPDPAALLAEQPLLVHAVGLLVAHYATVGRDLTITGTIVTTTPQGYEEAIAPFRQVWLP